MVRNQFSLSDINGGASSSKAAPTSASSKITTEDAFLTEILGNAILCDTLQSLMQSSEVQKILSDPRKVDAFGSLITRLDPTLLKKVPEIWNTYSSYLTP